MAISDKGIEFIKKEEGLRLAAYLDSVGIWTIGYGHTGGVIPGSSISREQAEYLLREDIRGFERIINNEVKVPLNQNQFDALVSFIFNVGPGRKGVKSGLITLKDGRPSTLLRCLNNGQYRDAANAFNSWVYAGGVVLKGLVNRRERERSLFLR
ncbi:lysozyme [Serratia quinivorans]|uniref:lysozyme n=1 Tax=Serratia quinivorans TaxID=137545 RepID=UPI001C48117B|nr:lysozyme [Serratia quinivorans]MBV6694018.1 lysozyme [Serratia quinivorans]